MMDGTGGRPLFYRRLLPQTVNLIYPLTFMALSASLFLTGALPSGVTPSETRGQMVHSRS